MSQPRAQACTRWQPPAPLPSPLSAVAHWVPARQSSDAYSVRDGGTRAAMRSINSSGVSTRLARLPPDCGLGQEGAPDCSLQRMTAIAGNEDVQVCAGSVLHEAPLHLLVDLRAPTACSVRIRSIRTEHAVMDKNKDGLGLFLYKIADCARMAFSSVRNRQSARTFFLSTQNRISHMLEYFHECENSRSHPGPVRGFRARGWYVTRGEIVADLMAVAVNGETYSVALAGPMHRMDGALKRHAKLLTELRATLEREA